MQSISALTGAGVSSLINKAISKRDEYWTEYRPERERMKKKIEDKRKEEEEAEIEKVGELNENLITYITTRFDSPFDYTA